MSNDAGQTHGLLWPVKKVEIEMIGTENGRHRRALPDRSAAAERGGQAALVLSPVQRSSIRAAILSVAARINAAPDRSRA